MKYKLNIQLFADTKTVTGSGTKITTTTYKPNYWQYTTNGSTWYNLRSASTSGSITNQTRLKNLVDYGSKVNSWTGTSTTSTTYNAITLPAYPTKASTSTTESESASVYISGLSLSDSYSGDGWGDSEEKNIIKNSSSTRTKTTTTSYTPTGYYNSNGQDIILDNAQLGGVILSLTDSDGISGDSFSTSFNIVGVKINKTSRLIDLQLWQNIKVNGTNTHLFYEDYTPRISSLTVTNLASDEESYTAILDATHNATSEFTWINQVALGTYTYNEDGTLELTIQGGWGGYDEDTSSSSYYYPMAKVIDESVSLTDIDQLTGSSSSSTGTRYGGAGDSYTPTSQTMTMYVQYDESTSTSYSAYSSITLPYITRTGYVVEGYYNGSTKIGGEGDTYTPTSSSITLYVNFVVSTKIYIKDSGNIKEISSCYYKENGSWVSKTIDEMYTILNNLTYYKDGG